MFSSLKVKRSQKFVGGYPTKFTSGVQKTMGLNLSSKNLNLKRRSFLVERKNSYADYKIFTETGDGAACGGGPTEKNISSKITFYIDKKFWFVQNFN
jgi:hypothetical protein